MSINTYRGLLARSDADKGEVSVDPDLRARTSAAKVVIEGTYATMVQTVGGLTQVATGWAEITGTITQTGVGAVTQSITGLIQTDLVGTITQTTPTINVDVQRRKCKLTVQNGKVSGSSNLTDFPVLLRKECLPSEMFDSDGAFPAQANGGDIKITLDAAGVTQLPCEIVAFSIDADPADGYAEIWTKLTLDHDDDTDFYIWYAAVSGTVSQPPADSTYGSEIIWSDYAYVGHNLLTDSTGNYTPVDGGTSGDGAGLGTTTATTNAWGNTTGARDFTYDSGYTYDRVSVPIDIHTEGTYVFSLQCWAQVRSTGNFKLMSAGDEGSGGTTDHYVSISNWGAGYVVHLEANRSGNIYGGDIADYAANQWQMWSALFTDHNSIVPFIMNGGSTEVSWNHGADTRPFNHITFGTTADNTPSTTQPGDICEGRLRFGSGVTADWVYTEYANQDDPGTFIVDSTPTAFDYLLPVATITQTTPAISQLITVINYSAGIAPISVHHLNQMRA